MELDLRIYDLELGRANKLSLRWAWISYLICILTDVFSEIRTNSCSYETLLTDIRLDQSALRRQMQYIYVLHL